MENMIKRFEVHQLLDITLVTDVDFNSSSIDRVISDDYTVSKRVKECDTEQQALQWITEQLEEWIKMEARVIPIYTIKATFSANL